MSMNLAEMDGIPGKIGKMSANFRAADACDRTARNTVLALLDWANRLMSVKTGEKYVKERKEGYQIRDREEVY